MSTMFAMARKTRHIETTSAAVVWNRPPRASRGPHPAHSRDGIARTAILVADREGIEAVSMRRIAAELGGGAASLYRYIKKKDELLDLMMDAVIAEQKLPKASGNWRKDLRNIAHRSRSMILRHPWMIELPAFRSSFGPDSLRWLEFSLKVIDELGLNIDEMLVIAHTLFAFVRGYTAGEIAEREAQKNSPLGQEEWIATRAHITRAIVESGKFPMFCRVVRDAKAPHDPRMAEKGF
ncbi:MAG: TetR/AcrR family transcriptional regulator C-terminal domain-containing protein, partial [Pirellulales bacterium]|nr:TetR/AcrR family transcriptional regulator C-terminal domain-containing protein [Pirellulales bacterium]